MTDILLEASQLEKRFQGPDGDIHPVKDVSVNVQRGEFVAIHGRSGSGKSTVLLILGTLLAPDKGSVRIAEHDPYSLTPNARAKFRTDSIGFIFQQFYLLPYLNVIDNVLVSTLDQKLPNAHHRANALLERFGLQERRHHRPSELSAGEQQRVALARAVLHSPPLLLADEPTGNLDADSTAHVLDFFTEFAASGGAIIMVTHNEHALAAAARRLRLNDGIMLEESH